MRRGPRALRHPSILRIFASTLIAYPGRFIDMTVLAWLVLERTDSAFPVAMLGFVRFSPFLFAGPFMGLLADRVPRVRIMRVSRVGLIAAAAVMFVLLILGVLQLWHIYVYTLVSGTMWNMEMPARRAYIAGIVRGRTLTAAVALDMLGWTVGQIVGMNTAGVLLNIVRPAYFYPVLIVMVAGSLVALRGLPVLWRPDPLPTRESARAAFGKGIRYVRGDRRLVGLLLITAITNFTGFSYFALLPVFSDAVLDTGPALLGLLMSADGFGALLMGVVLIAFGARVGRTGVLMLAGAAGLQVLVGVFSFSTWYPLSFGLLVLVGVFISLFSTMHGNLILSLVPREMRGRVLGLQMFTFGAFPLGSLVVGALADWVGPGMAVRLMTSAGLLMLGAVSLVFPDLWRRTGGTRAPGATQAAQAAQAAPGGAGGRVR